jgi:hypothetical protein
MQILAITGVVMAFALVCIVIYLVGRSLQRRGRDLTFVDPRYPDSMQAVDARLDISRLGRPYPQDDTSLVKHTKRQAEQMPPPTRRS